MKWFATWPMELKETLWTIATDICDGAAILGVAGLSQGYGHVSARVPRQNQFLITPARDLTDVTPEQLEVVDFEGRSLTRNSPQGAPSEAFLHARIYQTRSDVGGIARSLPECAGTFAIANVPIRVVHNFGASVLGTTQIFGDNSLIDSPRQAQSVVMALGERNSLLLRGNGCLVVGADVRTAVVRSVWLEESARLQYRATLLANSHPRGSVSFFDDEEVQLVGVEFSHPDRVLRKWDMLVRHARRALR